MRLTQRHIYPRAILLDLVEDPGYVPYLGAQQRSDETGRVSGLLCIDNLTANPKTDEDDEQDECRGNGRAESKMAARMAHHPALAFVPIAAPCEQPNVNVFPPLRQIALLGS